MKRAYIILLLAAAGCMRSTCNNTILQTKESPDRKYTAIAFVRDCGATTDYSPQVAIVRTGVKPPETGNVFIGDHSDSVSIAWLNATSLLVSSHCSVIKAEKTHDRVISIEYQ